VTLDLADLHGYRYHTGVTFAVHAPELPSAVLRGGRYDNIGKVFGRARPAVGFSIYLRDLVGLLRVDSPRAILAPVATTRLCARPFVGCARTARSCSTPADEVGSAEPGTSS